MLPLQATLHVLRVLRCVLPKAAGIMELVDGVL